MTYDDMESRLKGGGPPMQAATVQGGWRGMKDVTAPPSGPASTKPAAGSKSSLQQSLMHTIDCCSWHGLGQVSKAHVKGDCQVEGKIRLHDVVTPLKLPVAQHSAIVIGSTTRFSPLQRGFLPPTQRSASFFALSLLCGLDQSDDGWVDSPSELDLPHDVMTSCPLLTLRPASPTHFVAKHGLHKRAVPSQQQELVNLKDTICMGISRSLHCLPAWIRQQAKPPTLNMTLPPHPHEPP